MMQSKLNTQSSLVLHLHRAQRFLKLTTQYFVLVYKQ